MYKKKKLFCMISADKYELITDMFDSIVEMSISLGIPYSYLRWMIARHYLDKKNKCYYISVNLATDEVEMSI